MDHQIKRLLMSTRYFALCEKYKETNVQLPVRSTSKSAGYDFTAPEDIEIPSIWKQVIKSFFTNEEIKPTCVFTHVKSKMRGNEVLFLFNRSSNPGRGLVLANGVGVCDADYFENETNDGDIGFAFYNFMPWTVKIQKGQKIGQGVFTTYLRTDVDTATEIRSGGFGSTGE